MSTSDSEAKLRKGSTTNAQEQPSEPLGDHKGKLDSPSHFLIDFANQVMARAPPASPITDEFHELPADGKEEVLKRLVGEIMESLLKGLSREEKEEFFNVWFTALYEKLPWRSQLNIANKVMRLLIQPARPPPRPARPMDQEPALSKSPLPAQAPPSPELVSLLNRPGSSEAPPVPPEKQKEPEKKPEKPEGTDGSLISRIPLVKEQEEDEDVETKGEEVQGEEGNETSILARSSLRAPP